jgi:hypothetical protein
MQRVHKTKTRHEVKEVEDKKKQDKARRAKGRQGKDETEPTFIKASHVTRFS